MVRDGEVHTNIRSNIVEHLLCLEEEFEKYFSDLFGDILLIKVTRNSLLCLVAEVCPKTQEEFVELRN